MSDFNALGDNAQVDFFMAFAKQALPLWGLEAANCEVLKFRENAVFSLKTAQGMQAVMRIHRVDYHDDAALLSELQWIQALSEYGVNVPQVIPALDGQLFRYVKPLDDAEPRQVDVLAWIEGRNIGSIDGSEGFGSALPHYRDIGRLLAQIHNFHEQWQPPGNFSRHAWDEAGLLGENPWWGRFWELELLDDAQRHRIQEARSRAAAALKDYGQGSDRYGLIHADPLPENFLADENDTLHIIDFDDGGYGWHLFDFATALFFVAGEDNYADFLSEISAGYQALRPLPAESETRLPLFLLLRGFTYLGWVHTRSDTDTAREMGPEVVIGVMALVDAYLSEPL